MAITREHWAELQKEIRRLKLENTKLRRALHKPARKTGERAGRKVKREVSENGRAVAVLRRAGLLVGLSPEDKKRAAEWRALPEEEKHRVIRTLETTRFAPSLSETIIQDRG